MIHPGTEDVGLNDGKVPIGIRPGIGSGPVRQAASLKASFSHFEASSPTTRPVAALNHGELSPVQ
jgi:hypothetical protein